MGAGQDLLANAFGANIPDANPLGLGDYALDLRFPGQHYDTETGLNYNYYRDYEPTTGRYIESDPIGLAGDINSYAYVGGSPLNWTDMYGLSKGGRRNLGTEGFNKNSNPDDVARALAEAIKNGQKARAAALRALLKVIKRGGSMGFFLDPAALFRTFCENGDVMSCVIYCKLEPEDEACQPDDMSC